MTTLLAHYSPAIQSNSVEMLQQFSNNGQKSLKLLQCSNMLQDIQVMRAGYGE